LIRLAIRVARADAEIVLAELLDLAPTGLEERDCGEEEVEYAIYGAPGELPAVPALRATVGEALVALSTTDVADDWSDRWREFHQPVLIERRHGSDGASDSLQGTSAQPVPALHVRAPWCDPCGRDDALELVIDPGQAFGTGAHATTRLCLELLLEVAASGERGELIDVGTGSGVVAIAAHMLGFSPVLALDNDRASIEATIGNAQVAGVELNVSRYDVRVQKLEWATAPVVTANLVRALLLDLAQAMPNAPLHLLAGGLLVDEVDEVAAVFAERLGLAERDRHQRGEWAALWLSAPSATA
jgi:ribosomal protein L11 methyltransferase